MLKSPSLHRHSERGIALIITLAIVAMVAILVIAFAVSMRVERTASQNFNETVRARLIAQTAIDSAINMIRSATPLSSTTTNWAAAPGVIYRNMSGGTDTNFLYTPIVGSWGSINLNSDFFITGSNSFYTTPANSAITTGWANIIATNANNGLFAGNQTLLGRVAFWVDVESTKVNINTASNRVTAAINQSLPSDIDLRALESPLFNSDANVANFIAQRSSPYNTAEEMRRGLPGTTAATMSGYTSNKFFVTTGTFDTNTDIFGRSRIDVTAITSVGSPAWNQAYERMTNTLWATAVYPTAITDGNRNSLLKKYGKFGAAQILANIIDYQKAAGTTPAGNLDGDVTTAGFAAPALDPTTGIPQYFSGLKKSLYIDEVIVHVATNALQDTVDPTQSNTVVHVFVDVKFVNGFPTSLGKNMICKVEPANIALTWSGSGANPASIPVAEVTRTFGNSVPAYGLLGATSGNPWLNTTPASLPEFAITNNGIPAAGAPVLSSVTVNLKRIRLLNPGGTDSDIVDWMDPSDFTACYPTGMTFPNAVLNADIVYYLAGTSPNFNYNPGALVPEFHPCGLGKQDPKTRTFPGLAGGDLSYGTAAGVSSFQTNWIWLAATQVQPTSPRGSFTSRLAPEIYNLLADARFVEPGSGPIPSQIWLDPIAEAPMQSLGELTYIHTGYPWRTIRLRSVVPQIAAGGTPYVYAEPTIGSLYGIGDPNSFAPTRASIEANAAPDWLMLDFLSVGSQPTFQGRINVNTKFSGAASALTPRIPPIDALINATSSNLAMSATSLPYGNGTVNTNTDALAANIANRTFVAGSPYTSIPAYFTPGEICEVNNIGYFNDPTGSGVTYDNNPSKSRRQQLIRRISNLVTARLSTFTIWGIAQAIKDINADGTYDSATDLITSEVRFQAIVDRYEEGGQVKFRIRYHRYIYD